MESPPYFGRIWHFGTDCEHEHLALKQTLYLYIVFPSVQSDFWLHPSPLGMN